jgi:tetratricopeptide (TPR) repeat protein
VANLQGDYATALTFYEECLALRRELGYKRGVAATLADVANVRAKQGEYAAARTLYEESLTLFRELGNQRGMVSVLSGLACLAQAQGRPLIAAQLLSGVETLLAQLSARLDEPQQSDMERAVAALRSQLDAGRFNAAREQGSRLTLEEMIALAREII